MSSKKAIVGVSGSLMIDPTIRFKNYWKACVTEDYITSVVKAGGVPLILPVVDDEQIIEEQVKNLDAIIFTGGSDINPEKYNEASLEKLDEVNDRRDWYDLTLAKIVKKHKIPTLCICRGHQVATVSEGGTLYQDLSYAKCVTVEHDQYTTPIFLAHEVTINKNSLLYDILQKEKIKVNSFHHQIVKDVPDTFKVTGVSEDGVVEALEYQEADYFFLSIQWHPEMMAARDNKEMLKIFQGLIDETKTTKESR